MLGVLEGRHDVGARESGRNVESRIQSVRLRTLQAKVGCPIVQQPPSSLEQVRSGAGCPDLIRHHMRQGHFARMVRQLRRPVATARPEAVRHGSDAQYLDQLRERPLRERFPAPTRAHQPIPTLGSQALAQDLYGATAQRHTCSRFAFMRSAGTVQSAVARSTSSHVASRTSPDHAAINTWNSRASFVPIHARDARTALTASATSSSGSVGVPLFGYPTSMRTCSVRRRSSRI